MDCVVIVEENFLRCVVFVDVLSGMFVVGLFGNVDVVGFFYV